MNFEIGHIDGKPKKRSVRRNRSYRPRAATLRARVFASLVTLDALSILGGCLTAALIRGTLLTDSSWATVLAMLLPVYIVTAINLHAYSAVNLQESTRAIAKAMQALALAVSAVIFIAFCLKTSESFPRFVVALGAIFAFGALGAGRFVFVKNMEAVIGGNPFSIVLIRDGEQPIPAGNFSVLAASELFFDPDQHDPLMYDRLSKSLESADRVIVVCSPDRRMAWAYALKGANVQCEILAPELMDLAPLGLSKHSDLPTIVIASGPLGLVDRFIKRAFDVTVATIALMLLSPLFAVVALFIKFDSKGPVLFKQVRIGRANQMFKMLKFRSMRTEGCDGTGGRSTARDDDRITRVGSFIRRTSIDELPQLINVLRGDMSIVGPRPHALGSRAEDKLFWEVDRKYWHRHAAKPGLTGLAQVRGFRGATLIEADLRNRLQADLEYLDTWSIWRDLKIILMTFRVLLHKNAF